MPHSGAKGPNYKSTPAHPKPAPGKPAAPGSQRSPTATARMKGIRGAEMSGGKRKGK